MKKNILATVAALMVAFAGASAAQAEEVGVYSTTGIGGYNLNFKDPTLTSKTVLGGYVGAGYNVNDNFALELRLGTSAKGNISNVAGVPVNANITYALSYLAKPSFDISDGFSAYGLLGATTARLKVSSTGFATQSYTKTDFSYGAGIGYDLGKGLSLGAEYVMYLQNASIGGVKTNVTGITGSLSYAY